MNDRQASRRLSFNDRADNYRLARPAYPQRVYELLAEVCGLAEGAHVLEIGPGTGQATRRLLAEGGRVVAVEPGADLAAHLLADLDGPRLQVVHSDVEVAELGEGGFDLAVAATSLHWVRLNAALPKLAQGLRPGGWLAAWWTVFGDPERVTDFRLALSGLYERLLPTSIATLPASQSRCVSSRGRPR